MVSVRQNSHAQNVATALRHASRCRRPPLRSSVSSLLSVFAVVLPSLSEHLIQSDRNARRQVEGTYAR